ncbi:hypothetical protein GCM10010517_65110 [Streptosporangium fragile]|uniref:Uncharacterized protein n=1 Tax=Streptosporangium fragile TaxID=46186 RepID=A0ABN3W8W8_9ACTN
MPLPTPSPGSERRVSRSRRKALRRRASLRRRKALARDTRDDGPVPLTGNLLVTLVALLLAVLPGGVVAMVISIPDIRIAAGQVGTPGTMTVLRCIDLPNSKEWDCEGTFVFDTTGETIEVDTRYASVGDVFPAQLNPAGDRAELRGTQGVLIALTPFFMGLGIAVVGAWGSAIILLLWRGVSLSGKFGHVFRISGGSLLAISFTGLVVGLTAELLV